MSEHPTDEEQRAERTRLHARWRALYDAFAFPRRDKPTEIAGVLVKYVLDEQELPHLDFDPGAGTMPMGHGNAYVGTAIQAMLNSFYQTGNWSEHVHGVQMEYMSELSAYVPPRSRFQFFATGNEAAAAASLMLERRSRAASKWNMYKRIVMINRSFAPFGMTNTTHFKWDHAEEIDKYVNNNEILGFYVSPVDPDTYEVIDAKLLQKVRHIAERYGLPLIWDETVTGMGWTGVPFTAPSYATHIVFGGALGGGQSLGALASAEEYFVELPELAGQGNATSGNSLPFTAGLHTLRLVLLAMRKKELDPLIDTLDSELDRLLASFPDSIERVTGEGLLRALHFGNSDLASAFVTRCHQNGALLGYTPSRAGSVVRVTVPMVCIAADIEELGGIMLASLLEARDANAAE